MGSFIADPRAALKAKNPSSCVNNIVAERSGVRKIPTQIVRLFLPRFQRQYVFFSCLITLATTSSLSPVQE